MESYSLTAQDIHHSVVPMNTELRFRPISSDESEVLPHMPGKLLKASQRPSGLPRELEIMTVMYANLTVMHMLKHKLMGRMGAAHVTPLNDLLALHNVPVSYGSMLKATDEARYRGSYKKYLHNAARYRWTPPRRLSEPTELVTFTFPSVYADERLKMPSAIETYVTTTETWADVVQQELVHLTFEHMFA